MKRISAVLLLSLLASSLFAAFNDIYDDGLRYYYPELNEHRQALYRLLYDAVDSEKEELRFEEDYTDKEVETIFTLVLDDSPELFHVANRYTLTYTRGKSRIDSIQLSYNYTGRERKDLQRRILSKAEELKVKGRKDFAKELRIHDGVASAITYRIDSTPQSHTLVGALVNGSAVCDGYSKAFCLVARLSGLRCGIVTGTLLDDDGIWQDHAWNIVKVNGVWTYVDVTTDDQDGYISRAYFNLDQKRLERDHILKSPAAFEVTDEFVYYFYLTGLIVPSNEKEMRKIFLNELNILNRKGVAVELAFESRRALEFFLSRYQSWIDEYNRDRGERGFYGRYNYSVNDRQYTIRISQ
ncbi:MAG: hypothetical protein IJ831_07150 [Spirochaetales bacterium]|nr:hypothetical protein [Spirochaetales bacterium]